MPSSQNCSPNSHRKSRWNVLRVFDVWSEIKSDSKSYFGCEVDKLSERVHPKIAKFSIFAWSHCRSRSPVHKMTGNQKARIFHENFSAKNPNIFSNRLVFPNKHQILSILLKVTVQVPCSFHSKNLHNITCTQTQPIFSFYCECF